jgi:hypothetical protein
MLFLWYILAVLAEKGLRGDTNEPLEVPGKVALVKKANLTRNLGNAQIPLEEQAFGALNAGIENILMRCYSYDILERTCEVIGTHASEGVS